MLIAAAGVGTARPRCSWGEEVAGRWVLGEGNLIAQPIVQNMTKVECDTVCESIDSCKSVTYTMHDCRAVALTLLTLTLSNPELGLCPKAQSVNLTSLVRPCISSGSRMRCAS